MPLVASDLIAYSAADRPSDDVSAAGGAIDATVRPILTPLTAVDDLEAVSSSASDTGVLSVVGRLETGEITTLNLPLAGTTKVEDSTLFERVLSVQYSTTPVGTLTLRRRPTGAIVCVIPSGERGVSALFKGAAARNVGSVRYDKFFFKNVHGSLTLSSATIRLTGDPSVRIRIGLATALNDSGEVANRMTAPAGISFVDDNVDISVPGGGTLAPSQAIGVWVEQTLIAAASAVNSTLSVSLNGTS